MFSLVTLDYERGKVLRGTQVYSVDYHSIMKQPPRNFEEGYSAYPVSFIWWRRKGQVRHCSQSNKCYLHKDSGMLELFPSGMPPLLSCFAPLP